MEFFGSFFKKVKNILDLNFEAQQDSYFINQTKIQTSIECKNIASLLCKRKMHSFENTKRFPLFGGKKAKVS